MKRSLLVLTLIGVVGFATTANAGPADIPDLRLWLDAAQNVTTDFDDNVSFWGDVTDAVNNTVAQNVEEAADINRQPLFVANVINGHPVLRFDGLIDALDNETDNLLASGSDRTIFVVGKADTGDANSDGLGGSLVSVRRGSSLFASEPFFAAQIYDNVAWDAFDEACCGTADPTAIYTDGVSANHVVGSAAFPTSTILQPFISMHRVDSLLLHFGFNGSTIDIQQLFNNAPPFVTPETSTDTGFMIGGRSDKFGQKWEGDIAEVLIYERSLSPSEVFEVNNFLSAKYAIDLPPSADFNLDGNIDGADFLAWQRGFGITSGALLAQGDANGDGAVNAADLDVWEQQYGTVSALTAAVAAVPEPSTFVLLAVGVVGLVFGRQKR